MMNIEVNDVRMLEMWKTKIPLKIRIFVWMCFWGRIQVTVDLAVKGWPGLLDASSAESLKRSHISCFPSFSFLLVVC